MNPEEYIKSGMLEAYAMGLLSDEERVEIESAMAKYPELKAEINQIEIEFEQSAMSFEIAPPLRVKVGILNAINKEHNQTNAATYNLIPINRNKNVIWKYVAAAAITFLIGSGILNVVFYNNYNQSESVLAEFRIRNSVLTDNIQQTSLEMESYKSELAIVSSASVQILQLKGLPISPESNVTVYWEKATNEVYLAANSLPWPPEGKQYQLWAIVDGVPINAGMLDVSDGNALQKMVSMSNAQAFAITLEPKGGSVSPTMEAMIAMAAV